MNKNVIDKLYLDLEYYLERIEELKKENNTGYRLDINIIKYCYILEIFNYLNIIDMEDYLNFSENIYIRKKTFRPDYILTTIKSKLKEKEI